MISIQQDIHEQETLKAILTLMETQGWDVDRAMDALKVDERDLYRRSVLAISLDDPSTLSLTTPCGRPQEPRF